MFGHVSSSPPPTTTNQNQLKIIVSLVICSELSTVGITVASTSASAVDVDDHGQLYTLPLNGNTCRSGPAAEYCG